MISYNVMHSILLSLCIFADNSKNIETKVNVVYGIILASTVGDDSHGHNDVHI